MFFSPYRTVLQSGFSLSLFSLFLGSPSLHGTHIPSRCISVPSIPPVQCPITSPRKKAILVNQLSKGRNGYLLSSIIVPGSGETAESRVNLPVTGCILPAQPMKATAVSELLSSPPGDFQVVSQAFSTPSAVEPSLARLQCQSLLDPVLFLSMVIGIDRSALDFISLTHQFLLLLASAFRHCAVLPVSVF